MVSLAVILFLKALLFYLIYGLSAFFLKIIKDFILLTYKEYVARPRDVPGSFQVWPRASHRLPGQGSSMRSTQCMLWVRAPHLSGNVSRRSYPFRLYRNISRRFQNRKISCKRCSNYSSSPEYFGNHQVFIRQFCCNMHYSLLTTHVLTVTQSHFNASSSLDLRKQQP